MSLITIFAAVEMCMVLTLIFRMRPWLNESVQIKRAYSSSYLKTVATFALSSRHNVRDVSRNVYDRDLDC